MEFENKEIVNNELKKESENKIILEEKNDNKDYKELKKEINEKIKENDNI